MSENNYVFSIPLYDQWRFAKTEDKIRLIQNKMPLEFPDGRDFLVPQQDGKEDLILLAERFEKGQRFDERGRIRILAKAEDADWQEGVLSLFEDVAEVIRQLTGSQAFLYSGTLLGFIREKGFISFDKDMDCAYLSEADSARGAALEFELLGDALIKAGFSVNAKASCISVRRVPGSIVMVDIAHLFLKSNGEIGFPFGTVGTDPVYRDFIEPTQPANFMGFDVQIPNRPEKLIAQIYGSDWEIPNPNFKWTQERKRRDAEALLSYTARSRLAADDFYSHSSRKRPSRFAQEIVSHPLAEVVDSVIDLGCGDGLDSILLREKFENVLGLDRSAYAIRCSLGNAGRSQQRPDFVRSDILIAGKLSRISASLRFENSGSILFYSRFLLHALTNAECSRLLIEISNAANRGDFIAFEYRNEKDRENKKRYSRSFRNFINDESLKELLNSSGFRILSHESGCDFSKYGKENPDTSRVIAVFEG
ncbi:class I SAM-dependent methyltransferase [Arthrobacter sp. AG1021]|uniref:class I SAM-dependent methyltransferase n=1 Tax=Arthrobacter sp. AG1021 TaxID=2183908 RepID=UPI0011C49B04|nr:class I SAM-dependent methyltransferase [Arthrobacter sp. AG1021]